MTASIYYPKQDELDKINKIGIKPSEPIGRFLVKLNKASIVTRYPVELDKSQKDIILLFKENLNLTKFFSI